MTAQAWETRSVTPANAGAQDQDRAGVEDARTPVVLLPANEGAFHAFAGRLTGAAK